MVKGFPVVLSDRGAPFVAVEKNAPLATVAENGRGLPIRLVEKGAPPIILQGGTPWTPLDLFADGTDGTLWEPWDISTLFQDQAGTTPVTAGGDPVRRVLDKSGNSVALSQSVLANAFTAVRMPLTGRRNLLPWTEDFSNAAWSKLRLTITSNATTAPDGTITADLITTTTGTSAGEQVVRQVVSISQTSTFSAYVKKNNWRYVGIRTINYSIFDLDTQTWTLIGTGETVSAENLGNGWYRLSATTSTTGSANVGVSLHPNGTTTAWVAPVDGASVYVWGAQLELGSEPTPYQRVTNANDVHEDGVPDVWSIVSDYAGDVLSATLPFDIDGEILIAGTGGTIIEPVSYTSGSTFNLGTATYTGGTPGILQAIGPIVGVVLLDRAFTEDEKTQLIDYYKGKGAKGLLVEGPDIRNIGEIISIGTPTVTGSYNASTGTAIISRDDASNRCGLRLNPTPGKFYVLDVENVDSLEGLQLRSGSFTGAVLASSITGRTTITFVASSPNTYLVQTSGSGSGTVVVHSLRELRPQEDW